MNAVCVDVGTNRACSLIRSQWKFYQSNAKHATDAISDGWWKAQGRHQRHRGDYRQLCRRWSLTTHVELAATDCVPPVPAAHKGTCGLEKRQVESSGPVGGSEKYQAPLFFCNRLYFVYISFEPAFFLESEKMESASFSDLCSLLIMTQQSSTVSRLVS